MILFAFILHIFQRLAFFSLLLFIGVIFTPNIFLVYSTEHVSSLLEVPFFVSILYLAILFSVVAVPVFIKLSAFAGFVLGSMTSLGLLPSFQSFKRAFEEKINNEIGVTKF